MLLRWIDLLLSAELLQSADDTEARVAGLDDVIHIAVGSGIVWISKGLAVFFFLLTCAGLSEAATSLAKITSTAPAGPMTAISAEGQARLMSERRCFELITM